MFSAITSMIMHLRGANVNVRVMTTTAIAAVTKMMKKMKRCLSPSHKSKANATVVANLATKALNVVTKTNQNQNGGSTKRNNTFSLNRRPLQPHQHNPIRHQTALFLHPLPLPRQVPRNNLAPGWAHVQLLERYPTTNMQEWILLDSQSSTSIFCNPTYVTNIRDIPDNAPSLKVQTNGGTFEVQKQATVDNFRNSMVRSQFDHKHLQPCGNGRQI